MNPENKTLTFPCIICPRGCTLTVTMSPEQEILGVTGFTCKRGEEYAKSECICPVRTVTSTVSITGNPRYYRLPVITKTPIPKEMIFQVMEEIHKIRVQAPIHLGDCIMENIAGTGSALIAGRSIPKEGTEEP